MLSYLKFMFLNYFVSALTNIEYIENIIHLIHHIKYMIQEDYVE